MKDFNELGFAFAGIKTNEFAIIDDAYKKTGKLEVITGIGFGLDEGNRIIVIGVRFSFLKKEKQPFIIIGAQVNFEINKLGWESIYNKKENTFTFPEKLMTHLIVLTIGTIRGILHAKTEGTQYNSYILPTINVADLIKNDVVFTKKGLQVQAS